MATTTNLDAMMAKVADLRALAARATTQGEAEAAAAAAARIVAKYQIDEASIPCGDTAREEAVSEDSRPVWAAPRVESWRSILINGLATMHGCAVYADHRSRGVNEIKIAGRPSDVEIVRYLAAWLSTEVIRLSMRERGRAAQNAFRLGCVRGVLSAMEAARKVETAAGTMGAALALASRADASMAYLRRAVGRLHNTSRRLNVGDGTAFERGKAAGANINASGRALGSGRLALPA